MAKNKKIIELKAPKNRAQYVKLVKKGQFYHKNKDNVQALKYLTTAWKYDDTDPNLLIMVADSLFKIGNKMAAMELMVHALQKSPNDPNVASILGKAALEMDFYDLAEKFHQRYIELKPDDPIGYNNYATALRDNGNFDEAISLLQNILPIFPHEEILWNTLGSIVSFRDGSGEAIVFYEECLKLNPNNPHALNNIAPAYLSTGQLDKAEEAIKRSIKFNSSFSGAHMFYSSLLLNCKKLKEGWEQYNWRFNTQDKFVYTVKHNHVPYWQGESLEGKKIFIFGEQGIGDEILFTWLYNDIINEAKEVGLGCEERLVPLFQSSFPKSQVSRSEGRFNKKLEFHFDHFPDIDVSSFDYQCAAGDLAKIKWQNYDDINENSKPIMKPSSEKIAYWKEKIEALPHDISIGVSWRSGITHAKRARNYASIFDWVPFLKQKNVNFINVQYGDCSEELEALEKEHGLKIHNFEELDLKDDFEGTTAMMSSLDLVIGPGSAPIMQSAFAGIESWFFTIGIPWWCFGEVRPIWRQNALIFAKNDNTLWADYMVEQAPKFKEWIKNKKKK